MSLHTIPLKSTSATKYPSDVRSEHPVTSQSFIQYMLQLVCQVWFHIFKIVTYQPMFQVRNQSVDQVMGLPVFKSNILASTLMYYYHKPHMSLPVSISVPSPLCMHKPPSARTSIGCSIQLETFTVTKLCVLYCFKYYSNSTA